MTEHAEIAARLAAAQQPLRRGYRTLPQHTWVGVVWSKDEGPGKEMAECGHRHFVGPEEAMQCSALDEYCPAIAVDTDLATHAPSDIAWLLNRVAELEARNGP